MRGKLCIYYSPMQNKATLWLPAPSHRVTSRCEHRGAKLGYNSIV